MVKLYSLVLEKYYCELFGWVSFVLSKSYMHMKIQDFWCITQSWLKNMHHEPSKCQYLFTSWQSITFQMAKYKNGNYLYFMLKNIFTDEPLEWNYCDLVTTI